MKPTNILYTAALCALAALSACTEKDPVYGSTLLKEQDELAVQTGKSIQLQTNTPADFAGDSIVWVSADEAIATVGALGNVTGVAPGKTTVVATKAGKNLKSYTVWVYSPKRYYSIDGVKRPILCSTQDTDDPNTLAFSAEQIKGGQPFPALYVQPVLGISMPSLAALEIEDISQYTGATDALEIFYYNYPDMETFFLSMDPSYYESGSVSIDPENKKYVIKFKKVSVSGISGSLELSDLEIHFEGDVDYVVEWDL